MITRISVIVTILAGLAVGALNMAVVKSKVVKLQTDLQTQTAARQNAETSLASVKRVLGSTEANLQVTEQNLKTATAEREQAVADASVQTKKAARLAEDLRQSQEKFETADAHLARFKAAGLEPEQIISVATELKALRNDLATARKQNEHLVWELKNYDTQNIQVVSLPADLKGTVLISDPKWHFVVLDAGENQGMLTKGELLISRKGKLVARLKVTQVQKDRCIANLMPGWELAEILEGDLAIPAHPRS